MLHAKKNRTLALLSTLAALLPAQQAQQGVSGVTARLLTKPLLTKPPSRAERLQTFKDDLAAAEAADHERAAEARCGATPRTRKVGNEKQMKRLEKLQADGQQLLDDCEKARTIREKLKSVGSKVRSQKTFPEKLKYGLKMLSPCRWHQNKKATALVRKEVPKLKARIRALAAGGTEGEKFMHKVAAEERSYKAASGAKSGRPDHLARRERNFHHMMAVHDLLNEAELLLKKCREEGREPETILLEAQALLEAESGSLPEVRAGTRNPMHQRSTSTARSGPGTAVYPAATSHLYY